MTSDGTQQAGIVSETTDIIFELVSCKRLREI